MAFGDFTVDRNSTKYVLGSGGKIIPSATDEPAFEFNADGSYKGLLVEPAATNLCLQSEDFDTTWTKGGVTVVTDDIASPSGVVNADRLTSTTFTAISQNITTTVSTNYAVSIYVKQGTSALSWIKFEFSGGSAIQYGYQVNWSTKTITLIGGRTAATNPLLVPFGNDGWYKFSMICASGNNTSVEFGLIPDSQSATNYIYAWGAQVETGPIATSYIPTASAAVTRVKDDITQTGAQSLIGQTEGTLYLEVDWRLASGTEQYLLSVNDGTNSNRMLIYNSSGVLLQIYVEAGGAFIAGGGESSSAYSGIQKFAFAYADGDFELYRNGSSISSTGGSLASLGTLTDIDLGQSYSALQQANMHIRAVALYPTRLGAVELEVLTGAPTYGSYALMASSLGYTVE